eukprot:TRINITY_DN4092_c0_g1_i2.p2 TRINITY_DN4092_c0_g1~~TRINITY_DN4092_c0_g1_i2.p2  ORF type:complete len:120 (-),score=20.66 TRINITY_DN4092_c0_g1_i2:27-386(-)
MYPFHCVHCMIFMPHYSYLSTLDRFVYISDGGSRQVNISDETRQSIGGSVYVPFRSIVSRDMFKRAEEEVFHNMKFHSYPMFCSQQQKQLLQTKRTRSASDTAARAKPIETITTTRPQM